MQSKPSSRNVKTENKNIEKPCSTKADKAQTNALRAPKGNFANYYAIRRDVRQNDEAKNDSTDKRVTEIVKWINNHRLVDGIQCRKIERFLDIGCNNGQVTFELANNLKDQPGFVLGIDVDEDLVIRAREEAFRRGYVIQDHSNDSALGKGRVGYSSNQPRKRIRLDDSPGPEFQALIFTCEWTYLNASQKVVKMIKEQNKEGCDLITALSITKWVQLSYGDFGLRRFFARICSSLRPGGTLILEPQPYKSYKTLHKITKPESQERKNLKEIQIYPDDFAFILTNELGLKGPFIIQQRGQNGFLRELQAYLQPLNEDLHPSCVSQRLAILNEQYLSIPWVSRDRTSCV